MSDPTFMPLFVGDIHDDDAEYIDKLLQDAPPVDRTVTNTIHEPVETASRKSTRITTGYQQFVAAIDAFPILPPDGDRCHLTVTLYSTTSSDTVYLSDDPSKLSTIASMPSSGLAYALRAQSSVNSVPFSVDDYTGPLWAIIGTTPAGPVTLTWVAVSK